MDDYYVDNFQRLDHEAHLRDRKYDERYMDDGGNDVRELAEKAEAQRDSIREEGIVEKMMGKDFERYFEVKEEINRDHARDNAI